MVIVIGIIAAVLVVAMCVALIVGITELICTLHRIEQLLEGIEATVNKSPAETSEAEGSETGPKSAGA